MPRKQYVKTVLVFIAGWIGWQLLDYIKPLVIGAYLSQPVPVDTTIYGLIGLAVIIVGILLLTQTASEVIKKPLTEISLEQRLSNAEAHLFFPWYYFLLGEFSRLFGFTRDLNNVPRHKLIVNTSTKKAYWMCDYAQRLLTPVQKIQWVSERKRFLFSKLDKWCEERGYALVRECATEADLLEGTSVQALELPQILLHQHTDLRGFPKNFIVKFDFEVQFEAKIDALEVQVAVGYGVPTEWVHLDLREHSTTEVDTGKSGQPVQRLSLLSHESRRFTLIGFLFSATKGIERQATLRIIESEKQANFSRMQFISWYPTVYARFVGLERKVEKRFIIVYNEPPWEESNVGQSNPPVELLDAESTLAKQRLAELQKKMKESVKQTEG